MKYIFGNWKMYLNVEESVALAKELVKSVETNDSREYVVFPNTIAFQEVRQEFENSSIKVGAQNVAWSPKGAYTGATSAVIFKDAGATYSLVGHSERRYIFGETNEDVRKKLEACLDVGLTPVLCIGETKEDKDAGKAEYRLKKQLMKALEGLNLNGNKFIVAYEPVWAISKGGVGESCDPDLAEETQGFIKNEIKQYLDQDVPVLYGGSVKADNVASYLSRKNVDGVLVGSASTTFDSFSSLIKNVA